MTESWLDAAQDDLSAANQLLLLSELTNLVAFQHSLTCSPGSKAIFEKVLSDLSKNGQI